MHQTRSKDGTLIAFDQIGEGPPVILVLGAFNDRKVGAPLAAWLAGEFTVFSYDRRGRGESGDTAPYAIEREVEDLEAVIRAAGGSAAVAGYSSGAALALAAASMSLPIDRLALYELPPPQPAAHATELAARVASGRRGDAVEYFQRQLVGIPEPIVAQLRNAPFRPALEKMAHTLVYDAMLVAAGHLSPALLAKIHQPTLAIAGAASPPFMREAAGEIARSLPNGRAITLDGATHDIDPEQLGPVLARFLRDDVKRSLSWPWAPQK